MEPEKPFACGLPECGMTFTNEDHLHVHTKKHDMVLQLGMEQKAAFVADQTPTPTRFIRNCEEVGLFQDLQAVNPFDEGFKRAMETKHGILSLEGPSSNEDALHTPHLVFPLESGDCTLYKTNNQRNITISRSSSDESGAIKEYETTKISKLTNEVTTISRIVGKEILDRVTDDVSIVRHEETTTNKDCINETVSYTNNVIKLISNVEIRKDFNIDTKKSAVTNTDSVNKDTNLLTDNKKDKMPLIISQKSLDLVVDSLSDMSNRDETCGKNLKRNFSNTNNKTTQKEDPLKVEGDYEVIIKLPNGKQVRMKTVEEVENDALNNAKEKLNKTINNKLRKPTVQRVPTVPNAIVQAIPNAMVQSIIPTGTLIPVTIMNPTVPVIHKIPIEPLKRNFKTVKRKSGVDKDNIDKGDKNDSESAKIDSEEEQNDLKINSKHHLERRSAASKRYRDRLKLTMQRQNEENRELREANMRLTREKAALQLVITKHLKDCPTGKELMQKLREKLQNASR